MDWTKIIIAITIIGMMAMLYPRLKQASEDSEKGTKEDWMSFIKPMALVILFIIALIVLSR